VFVYKLSYTFQNCFEFQYDTTVWPHDFGQGFGTQAHEMAYMPPRMCIIDAEGVKLGFLLILQQLFIWEWHDICIADASCRHDQTMSTKYFSYRQDEAT
jgi:hypothetical protein